MAKTKQGKTERFAVIAVWAEDEWLDDDTGRTGGWREIEKALHESAVRHYLHDIGEVEFVEWRDDIGEAYK